MISDQIQAANDEMWTFLSRVLDEVNRSVPGKKQVRAEAASQRKFARTVDDPFDAEIIRDSAYHMPFWREYERTDLALLFRELATTRNLSRDDWTTQLKNFERGLPKHHAHMSGNRPTIDAVPSFDHKDVRVKLKAKIAFALIWLAGQSDEGYRVLECELSTCRRLFLRSPNETGPKRTCCSTAHTNANRTAKYRQRQSAAKHK